MSNTTVHVHCAYILYVWAICFLRYTSPNIQVQWYCTVYSTVLVKLYHCEVNLHSHVGCMYTMRTHVHVFGCPNNIGHTVRVQCTYTVLNMYCTCTITHLHLLLLSLQRVYMFISSFSQHTSYMNLFIFASCFTYTKCSQKKIGYLSGSGPAHMSIRTT